MADEYGYTSLVIDCGTSNIKAGVASEDIPRTIIPSVVGHVKHAGVMVGMNQNACFVGDEALAKRGVLNLQYPITRGLVRNWEEMEIVFDHLFENELVCNPQEHPMLFSEPVNNLRANREELARTMFEKYRVPGLYLSIAGVLALYATGNLTGCTLDCGEGLTSTVPVYEGYAVSHAMQKMEFAGVDVTENLTNLLLERGYAFTTSAERDVVREIKESLAYVAADFDAEMHTAASTTHLEREYELPDGQSISIGDQRFRCTEILFQPMALLQRELPAVHEMVFRTISQCDIDLRKDMYSNVVVTGGSTSFLGFPERLSAEIAKLAPKSMRVKVLAPPERKYSVWIGGSILASLSTFQSMWISKAEYDETGVAILQRKC